MTSRFAAYVAIDWSGAKGKQHKGIAIAEARGGAAPRLVRSGHAWSREEVADWLLAQAAKEPTLFGFDFSFAPPLMERGEYLPGEAGVPKTARAFLIKYQDRVLMGKDTWAVNEFPTYFRMLETDDEYFDYYRKRHAFWKMYGLGLPDDVLKKIYYKNALRLIPKIDRSAFPE